MPRIAPRTGRHPEPRCPGEGPRHTFGKVSTRDDSEVHSEIVCTGQKQDKDVRDWVS